MKLDTLLEGPGVRELLMRVQQELIEERDLDVQLSVDGDNIVLSYDLEMDDGYSVPITIRVHKSGDSYAFIESTSESLGDFDERAALNLQSIMSCLEKIEDQNQDAHKDVWHLNAADDEDKDES